MLNQNRFLIPTMFVIALLAAATGFYVSIKLEQQEQQQAAQQQIPGLFWPNPRQFNEFSAVDDNNETFGLDRLQGHWSLVFFGYTNCPDICPITLSVLAQAYPALKARQENVQVLFATVDPERDTPEQLTRYVDYFNPEFIGIGGSEQQVKQFTRQMGVAYFLNKEDAAENYLVDHSASVFLIDPEGRMVGKLSPPHQPDSIEKQFSRIQEFIDAQG